MQGNCGECDKPFSHLCEAQGYCEIHKAKCFSCKQCKFKDGLAKSESEGSQISIFERCHLCERLDNVQDLYLDWRCSKYTCRYHFIGIKLFSNQIKLPCGCTEAIEQILNFTNNFCNLCGRKNSKGMQNQFRCCVSCYRRQFKEHPPKVPIKRPLQVQNTQQHYQIKKLNQCIQSYKAELSKYKNEIFLLEQNMKISEFARNEIKKAICDNERDKECSICLQHFNQTTKKPIMVCLQQHLVCQECLDPKLNLMNCPLCSEPIQRPKISASRQRNKTLLLQRIICEPYVQKLKKCIKMNEVEINESQAKYQQKQTQTNQSKVKKICHLEFISTIVQLKVSIKKSKIISRFKKQKERKCCGTERWEKNVKKMIQVAFDQLNP